MARKSKIFIYIRPDLGKDASNKTLKVVGTAGQDAEKSHNARGLVGVGQLASPIKSDVGKDIVIGSVGYLTAGKRKLSGNAWGTSQKNSLSNTISPETSEKTVGIVEKKYIQTKIVDYLSITPP